MLNSSLRIRRKLSLSKLTSSATVRTPNLRSFQIASRTFSMLSSATAERGRPMQSSSFTLSLPSENRLCHSNTPARDMQSSPLASVNNSSFGRGFLQFNKKLDVNSLFTFVGRHFPTEDKNTPVFEDASTFTE